MQVTESQSTGLARELRIVIPAETITGAVDEKLSEIAATVRLPGFRPGKAPLKLLRQRFGKSIMGEVLENSIQNSTSSAIEERGLKPAMTPKVEIDKFEEGADLEFRVSLELLPEIGEVDFAGITLERPKAEVEDSEVEKALERLARANRGVEPVEEARPAGEGDIVVCDFVGRIDGVEFDGGKAEGMTVEIGAGRFIPGFEEGLMGASVGEERQIKASFPADYPAPSLAGKDAIFDVKVTGLRTPVVPAVDDDLAKKVGLEGLADLRKAVRAEIEREFTNASRARVKRQLMDKLAERFDFPVPPGMVDQEFQAIWQQVDRARAGGRLDPEDAGKDEDTLKGEYRDIAERRVRLGLLLADIGQKNNISVGQDELNRAVMAEAARHPGQEKMVLDYYRSTPAALESLRAPLLEDKVVDFILELVPVTEKQVTPAELFEDGEARDGQG